MEAPVSELWYLSKEHDFGMLSITAEFNQVRALWLRDVIFENPGDDSHGIISKDSQDLLRSRFEGEINIFSPVSDLDSVFQNSELRAIRVQQNFGGGYIIVVPGKEFEVIGQSSVSLSWAKANTRTFADMVDDMSSFRMSDKSPEQYAIEEQQRAINSDPLRRPENLMVEEAKRTLATFAKYSQLEAGSSNSKGDDRAYPHFLLSRYFVIGISIMLLLSVIWYFAGLGFYGAPFVAIELLVFAFLYDKWRVGYQGSRIKEDETYDVYYLWKLRLVEGIGTGQSITKIYGVINNLSDKKLKIKVEPGTYFKSDGEHQNMVSNQKYEFVLNPLNGKHIEISATCINANRPIPAETDRFVGLGKVSKKVRQFLELAESEDPMTIQAGVWACTDGLNREQIRKHLISRDQNGNTFSSVSNANIERAQEILGQLNIKTNL